jgi:hypothetical protein
MSTHDIALVREQGVEFAVVSVGDNVVENSSQRDSVIRAWVRELGRPVVLIGARRHRLFGRTDIVRFMSNVHPSQLPWRRITV